MGGSVAQMFLQQNLTNYKIKAFVSQIYNIRLTPEEKKEILQFSGKQDAWFKHLDDSYSARFPSLDNKMKIQDLLLSAKEQGKSYGGFIDVVVEGVPDSLGQAVFHKLKAELASAMLGIPASNYFSLGDSELVNQSEGSQLHKASDPSGSIYGGIRGGFSTGEKLCFRVGFKPTSSVLDTAKSGRHDPCILPRAIPVVEAMTHLVLADQVLWRRLDQL
jgi:chorismate synthase